MPRDLSIYGGRDPRDLPIYTLDEAAHILWIPTSTLRVWTFGGRWHETSGRQREFVSLIMPPPETDEFMLSFTNLIEAHVLHAIRRVHKIKMSKVRAAMRGLREDFETLHPLAHIDLYTEGQNILVKYGGYVNMSHGKQQEMEKVIDIYVRRVEREEDKIARFYPFSGEPIIKGPAVEEQPRLVSVDPFVSFGRPVLAGTNIRTEIVAERFYAGDPIDELSEDYHLTKQMIEAAIRYERHSSLTVEAEA
jgi:uncharacterized protein (DUF433 family)